MLFHLEFGASPLLSILVLAAVGLIGWAMVPEILAFRKQPPKAAAADLRGQVFQAAGHLTGLGHALVTGDGHLAVVTAIGAGLGGVVLGLILRGRRLVRVAGARSGGDDDGQA